MWHIHLLLGNETTVPTTLRSLRGLSRLGYCRRTRLNDLVQAFLLLRSAHQISALEIIDDCPAVSKRNTHVFCVDQLLSLT